MRRLLGIGLLACLAACGPGATARAGVTLPLRAPAPTPALAGHPTPIPGWPPAETWVIPPAPPQAGTSAIAGWPTPTPDPAPDGAHHPAGSPFAARAHGYDASWPQCGSTSPPRASAFGIIGINGGRSFTLNPCFPQLLKAVPANGGIYLNTGFTPQNTKRLLASCAIRAALLPGVAQRQQLAYALGCSTTLDTLDALRTVGIAYPSIWWLDVEETNSWDDPHPDVNRYSIEGQLDVLAATGRPIGVYATFGDWKQITGGAWSDPRIAADWVAGESPQDACSHPGFSGAPVWLAQELATWPGAGYDSDYAC